MSSSAPDATRESAPDDSSRVEEAAVSYDSVDAGVRALGRLEKAEFNRAQAEAVVLATRDLVGDLATKSEFKTDIARLEGEIATIHQTMATQKDLAQGLAQLEARVNQNALRNVMWVVGINFVVIVGGLAIAVTVLIDALKV